MSEAPNSNPIGEKYAQAALLFMEEYCGQVVTEELIDNIANLLRVTLCEFVGLTEASAILQVSRQRTSQLQDKIGPEAGRIIAGRFWLKEQVESFRDERAPIVQKYLESFQRRLG